YHFWLAHMYSRLGSQALATHNAEQAIEEARRCGDDATLGKAHGLLALEGHWSGRSAEGIEHGRQAVALLEGSAGQQVVLGTAHSYLGANQGLVGRFDEALSDAARAHAVGTAVGDPRLQCYAAFLTGWLEAMRGEWAPAVEACERSRSLAPDPVSRV